MSNRLIIFGVIELFLVGSGLFLSNLDEEILEEKQYHGPVPIGYDIEHFRSTGETIREEIG